MNKPEELVVMQLAAVAYLYCKAPNPKDYEADLHAAADEFGRMIEVVPVEINAEGGEA